MQEIDKHIVPNRLVGWKMMLNVRFKSSRDIFRSHLGLDLGFFIA